MGVSVKEHDGIELEVKGKGYRIRSFRLDVDEEGKEEKFIVVWFFWIIERLGRKKEISWREIEFDEKGDNIFPRIIHGFWMNINLYMVITYHLMH